MQKNSLYNIYKIKNTGSTNGQLAKKTKKKRKF